MGNRKLWITLFIAILAAAALLSAGAASAQDQPTPTVKLGSSTDLGSFLVGPEGMTLYLYTADTPGVSNCYDQCATNWPPLLVQEGEMPTLDAGIPGMLGVVTRTDDTYQVAFNGMPLYYWKNDAAVGDTTGQGVGDVWWVVKPATVSLGSNADLGSFLVDANGMTLYMYTADTPDTSTCYDQCAQNWPPLMATEGETASLQPGLAGTLGTTARTDGGNQVTYNGMPLYFWKNDAAPGDATGQAVGDVWYVVQPPTLATADSTDLGSFLVGPNGMTLYMYTKDTPGVSNCYDQCAVKWPPLLVGSGQTPAVGDGVTGEVSVITRTDGTMQVAYNGMPLYYWIKDVIPGDTTGQNVGEVWFVVAP